MSAGDGDRDRDPRPWYEGLSNEEIYARLERGEYPGSRVPGAVVEVPAGFLRWTRDHRLAIHGYDATEIVIPEAEEAGESLDEYDRKRARVQAQLGLAMTQEQFRAFLDLMMCADPWPVAGDLGRRAEDALLGFADVASKALGYADWVEAYHDGLGRGVSRDAR